MLFAAPPVVGSGSLLLQLKADAANVTLGAGNVVCEWSDISGLNNHFSQPAASRQPLWVDSTLNGHPTIRFDGNSGIDSDWLQAAGAGLNIADRTQFTFFAVTYNTTDPFSLFDSAPQVVNPFRFGAFGAGFPTPRFHVEFWDRSPGVPLNLHSTGSVVSITGSRNGTNNRVLDVRELSLEAETAKHVGHWQHGGRRVGRQSLCSNGRQRQSEDRHDQQRRRRVLLHRRRRRNAHLQRHALGGRSHRRRELPPRRVLRSTTFRRRRRRQLARPGLANYGRAVLDAQPVAYWRLETNLSPPTDSADAPGFPQNGSAKRCLPRHQRA